MSLSYSIAQSSETSTSITEPAGSEARSPAPRREASSEKTPPCPARTPPTVPVALALIAGTCLDRYSALAETKHWVYLASAASIAGLLSMQWRRLSAVLIVLALIALAAAWHHRRWSEVADDDLGHSVNDTPRPAWIKGVIVESLGFRPGKTDEDSGSTRFSLDTTAVHNAKGEQACSGRVLVSIAGDRTDLVAGCLVEAAGSLSTVAGPLNPGEFNYRDFLRAQGVRLRLVISDSEGIWSNDSRPDSTLTGTHWFESTLGKIRAWSQRRLTDQLEPKTAALASALLLGRREGIDSDLNDAFTRTGTTHLLAISGLHLQVLAFTLGACFRGMGLGRRSSYALVALATLAYALLVGLMPSVARSAAMTLTICAAGILSHRQRRANTFALAMAVTLALNPSHLFDIGCQLSFLAVAAIFWVVIPALDAIQKWRVSDPLDRLELRYATIGWRRARALRLHFEESVILSAIVWLAALPLVALTFHLVSPIGVILNIPLIPVTSLALFSSGLTLISSLIWEPLSIPFARLTTILLDWTTVIVQWGERQSWGSWYVAEPDGVWVLGLYALGVLLVTLRASRRRVVFQGVALAGFSAWLLVGSIAFPWGRTTPPHAEILAVGHGLAVVIETAPGHAILYDCGRMRDPSVGRRIIAPALWARGISTIDSIMISHADADHYNGLHELLERFNVGEILVSENFESLENPGLADLLKPVRSQGIPIREVVAGSEWKSRDGRLEFKILHPEAGFSKATPDNARSLVLDVSDGKHHLLLTGDLEGSGLNAMLNHPLEHQPDVLLSPHHGGWSANPAWVYDWAKPRNVVVSQRPPMPGGRDALSDLKRPLYRTWERGALRLTWEASGILVNGLVDRSRHESGR